MIIDNVSLNGREAYLASDTDIIDLSKPPHRGKSADLGEGQVLEVAAVDLHIECENLDPFMRPFDKGLFQLSLEKEMFPDLFGDPYRLRAHTIAGFNDFRRGSLSQMHAMLIDNIATLVSTGEPGRKAAWTSQVYRLAHPVTFESAAWEMATTRLTPPDAFRYVLKLIWWDDPTAAGDIALAKVTHLADGLQADAPRAVSAFPASEPEPKDVRAYQIEFVASVVFDSAIGEFDDASGLTDSIGRPLLLAINLLERWEPAHYFASLHELSVNADEFMILSEHDGLPRRLFARVPLAATLGQFESIKIDVHPDFAGRLDHMTARLDARVFVRPADERRPGG